MTDLRCVQQANAILGEGPLWDSSKGVLYWVDIKRPAVFRFSPLSGQTGHWPMPRPIGCVALAQSNRLIFADADGFGFLNLASGDIKRIADPESDCSGNRFNDGKVDRMGRFWAGTMDDLCLHATGSLYRLDPDGSVHRMVTDLTCSNGLGWSPDNSVMYFTDSMTRTIYACDFNLESGAVASRRVFARLKEDDGFPDGLAVDSAGFVWSAIWDGWRVIRFAPDGSIDREVRMPVQRPSSCVFGGADVKTLYITSACVELSWRALEAGPLAGSLFAIDVDVPGQVESNFNG